MKASIRIKIVFLFLSFALILLITSYFIDRLYLIPNFDKIELSEAKRNIKHFSDTLEREISHLDLLCQDWAIWDDTYNFMKDKNHDYIASNLIDNSLFTSSKLNLIYYWDNKGNFFYGKDVGFNKKNNVLEKTLFTEYKRFILPGSDTVKSYGILTIENKIVFVSFQKILKSDGTGPTNGTLCMARILTEQYSEVLKKIIKINFDLWVTSNPSVPKEISEIKRQMINNDNIYIENTTTDIMRIYTFLKDIKGENSVILKSDFKKDVLKRMVSITKRLLIILLFCSFFLFFALYYLIKTMIIKPIMLIINFIHKVKKSNDLSFSMDFEQKDEIGELFNELSSLFNHIMLNEQIQNQLHSKNKMLKELNITDPLTNTYNKRYLLDALKMKFDNAIYNNQVFSIIILDIDYFKKINDFFGHQAGDEILKIIASILKNNVRANDIVARYGGEEFVVLAPDTDYKEAYQLAERLRYSIENGAVMEIEKDVFIRTTASFGISVYAHNKYKDIYQLFREADDALLKAKREGRNRVYSLEKI